eukprot:303921-Alexandrium_andersonii.AAC.1
MSADVYKAFDQINRPILVAALAMAGCPQGVLQAYATFLGGLAVHNVLNAGVGQGTQRPCSIPQGCPWSMLGLTLLTVPWARL